MSKSRREGVPFLNLFFSNFGFDGECLYGVVKYIFMLVTIPFFVGVVFVIYTIRLFFERVKESVPGE